MHYTDRPAIIEFIRSREQEITERRFKAGKLYEIPKADPGEGLFTILPANTWIETEQLKPSPKMLFDNFWYEGELCILFADTNMGKSILAVQLGNSIARAEPVGPFAVHSEPCNVLYMDFELSGKQFQLRYTDGGLAYDFGRSFFRAEFNPLAEMPFDFKDFDEYVNEAIESAIRQTGADVLIIDNITCLRSGTERAADALPLMKHLKSLKTKHDLSILVLAHTPKRNPANPITRNDLQGSKMLINFADSAFTIGDSHTRPGYRYLKQVKQRSGSETFGAENVCLCKLDRICGLLGYTFHGHAAERDHLRTFSQQERRRIAERASALHAAGYSQRKIAAELKINLSTVNKLVNEIIPPIE